MRRLILILTLVLFVAFCAFTLFIGYQVIDGITHPTTREETVDNRTAYIGDYKAFAQDYHVQTLTIPSGYEDHKVPVIYVNQDHQADWVVLVHGMGGTKESLTTEMRLFLDMGFNVLAYDQRNSGENIAPTNTNGILESYDALDAVTYTRSHMKEGGRLILFGQSYGGATAAIAFGRDASLIDALVLDCPVSNVMDFVDEFMADIEEESGLPLSYMKQAGDLYGRLKYGFSFTEKSNVPAYLGGVTKPVLVFNSEKDTVTPAYMGQAIYDAIPHQDKKLVTSKTAAHCLLIKEDPDLYRQGLVDFFQTCGFRIKSGTKPPA